MQGFFDIALGFPTVLWTAALLVVLAYWLFVILGALDLELLDVDFETDLDVDLDLDVEAPADADAPGPNPFVKIAVALGVGQVPVTILISFFAFSGWMVSYFGSLYLSPLLKFGAAGAVILGIAFVLAAPMMGAFAHPLKKVFETKTRRAGADLIGQVCVITTTSVDSGFGQARLDDGGAGLLLKVRCESDDNGLRKGSQALIIGHEASRDVYFIEPYEQFLGATDGVELHTSVTSVTEHAETSVNAKREGQA